MTIEIGEHCFGPICRINGQDLLIGEYSKDGPNEEVRARELVLKLLKENSSYINSQDWKNLLEILANSLPEIECLEENYDTCDQCGSYNSFYKYEKKD